MKSRIIKTSILVSFFVLGFFVIFFLKKNIQSYYSKKVITQVYQEKPNFLFGYKTLDEYNKFCKEKNKTDCQIFLHQKFFADLLRISRIQYIGQMVFREEIPYFFDMMNLITGLKPYEKYPYLFSQLIGPIQKNAKIDEKVKKKSRTDTVKLGKKGIEYICMGEKCPSYDLPNHLAFNYFHYLKSDAEAEKYYKLASKQIDAPEVTKNMPAIVAGSLDKHLKSMYLWFGKIPKNIDLQNKFEIEEYDRYLKKSVFELSLYFIQKSSEKSLTSGECLQDFDCLKNKGYIKEQILENIQKCEFISKNKKTDGNQEEDRVLCQVLFVGVKNGRVKSDGNLEYPLNTTKNKFKYARHPVAERRRIMKY